MATTVLEIMKQIVFQIGNLLFFRRNISFDFVDWFTNIKPPLQFDLICWTFSYLQKNITLTTTQAFSLSILRLARCLNIMFHKSFVFSHSAWSTTCWAWQSAGGTCDARRWMCSSEGKVLNTGCGNPLISPPQRSVVH